MFRRNKIVRKLCCWSPNQWSIFERYCKISLGNKIIVLGFKGVWWELEPNESGEYSFKETKEQSIVTNIDDFLDDDLSHEIVVRKIDGIYQPLEPPE